MNDCLAADLPGSTEDIASELGDEMLDPTTYAGVFLFACRHDAIGVLAFLDQVPIEDGWGP